MPSRTEKRKKLDDRCQIIPGALAENGNSGSRWTFEIEVWLFAVTWKIFEEL